ncbi:cbb3-type cytochrome c oxidase subunit CcoP (plasmid) [Maritalea myrionectae]|uniref:Cbb3-type cytochrome c oxidase subunit n=1 Tax=Maritalea myrionectae TaxID=454601 RepID=A0A2R4MJE8_9HYPH|nr:cytochrome-c oxidase, cbb3-type subunit III [Maritalea myrionectae]AVX06095.1 cbb3-type cytochrome c oxidase subunit CcoP [Maritalea myrionectae]
MKNETDPKELPGADPHTGNREIDPVTGYETTGHEWSGIKELNTAFPKIVIWALIITHVYAVVAWILLPAWPYGNDYTKGLLGLDQGVQAVENYNQMVSTRNGWLDQFDNDEVLLEGVDKEVWKKAQSAADRLYADNCAACHGEVAQGNLGYPVLNDAFWLWGSDPKEIARTIKFGINSTHEETRYAEMPAFDWLEKSDRSELTQFVVNLRHQDAELSDKGQLLFEENCAACHGDNGLGGLENGAPSLTDSSVIFGQDQRSVAYTIRHGRQGVMPAWVGRLTTAEINLLSLYLSKLGTIENVESAK